MQIVFAIFEHRVNTRILGNLVCKGIETDRLTLRFLQLFRDRWRRERILEFCQAGKLTDPQDCYYPAVIMQHGRTSGDDDLAKVAGENLLRVMESTARRAP